MRFRVELPDRHEAIGCEDEAAVRRVLEGYRAEVPETLFGGVMVYELREDSAVGMPRSVYEFLHQDD